MEYIFDRITIDEKLNKMINLYQQAVLKSLHKNNIFKLLCSISQQ